MLLCPRRWLIEYRGLPLCVLDPLARRFKVAGVNFASDKGTSAPHSRNASGSAAHIRINNRVCRFDAKMVKTPRHKFYRLLHYVIARIARIFPTAKADPELAVNVIPSGSTHPRKFDRRK